MDCYRGFGKWNTMVHPQASYMETSVRWQGFNLPPFGNVNNFSWSQAGNFGMPVHDNRYSSDRLPFHSGFEASNGFGSNSGCGIPPSLLPAPRNSTWDPNSRPSLAYTRHKAITQDKNWSKNCSTEMGSSGVPINTITGQFKKKYRKKKKKPLSIYINASYTRSFEEAKKKDSPAEQKILDQSKTQNKTAETTEAQNGRENKVSMKKEKLKKKKLKKAQEAAALYDKQTVKDEHPMQGNKPSFRALHSGTVFTCSLCRFRTEDEVELERHFRTCQHRDTVNYLYNHLPQEHVNFIKSYLISTNKSVSLERQRRNLNSKNDSFKGIGQEHFMHRVDAVHCFACNVLLHDNPADLEQHVKSQKHNLKRRAQSKGIKSNCVNVARALLKDERVTILLDRYVKGDNPFGETNEDELAELEDLVTGEDEASELTSDIPDCDITGMKKEKPCEHSPQRDEGLDKMPNDGVSIGGKEEDAAEAP
ncbi:A-kinase anchor protein 8-like [Pelobates fuscus]|uniref:A-kinase anchor protein 8-like n=1 Tax=Pelobates fuscus TaxID=191477 RepID=UPI002FE46634